MAEALGIAASTISVTGLAGHLAQSSTFLYTFFKNIKNAPEYIENISDELRTLSSILITIERSFDIQDANLDHALKYCDKAISKLSDEVKRIEPAADLKKRQKLWRQVHTAMKGLELTKHLRTLERAKTMLIQCCANATRSAQSTQVDLLHGLQSSLGGMTVDLSAHGNTVREIQRTVESISDTATRLNASSALVTQATLQTSTTVDQVLQQTLDIQASTKRIEAASKELVGETLENRPDLMEAFGKHMEHTISSNVEHYLQQKQPHRVPKNEQRSGHNDARKTRSPDNTHVSPTTGPLAPHQQHMYSPQYHVDHFTGHWIKQSSVSSHKILIQNSLFGTISVQSTSTSYCPADSEGSELKHKEVSHTVVSFLPAKWLFSQGAMLVYRSMKLIGASRNPSPNWQISTVNIVADEADIVLACRRLDLVTIRTLFDNGDASPFDVDTNGRNLLGHVAVGTRFITHDIIQMEDYLQPTSPNLHLRILERMSNLLNVVDMLISFGVGTDNVELDNQLPFDSVGVLLWVDEVGHYLPQQFPNVPFNSFEDRIHSVATDFLSRQQEWPLSWDPDQLSVSCQIGYDSGWAENKGVANYVHFWVTSTSEQVDRYLQAKLFILRRCSLPDRSATRSRADVESALHGTIHYSAEVIALLSEHDYNGLGPPWLRHRFKKLIRVGAFTLTVLAHLLNIEGVDFIHQHILDEISQHAQSHNARIYAIWRKALYKAGRETESAFGQLPNNNILENPPQNQVAGAVDYESIPSSIENEYWETDDSDTPSSGWETEEEWEEGYMVDKAIDRDHVDYYNPRTRGWDYVCSGMEEYAENDFGDYDEEYWSHVYPDVKKSSLDETVPDPSKGKLRVFVEGVTSVLSSIY